VGQGEASAGRTESELADGKHEDAKNRRNEEETKVVHKHYGPAAPPGGSITAI
jgi:hypothetical protein